MEQMSNTRIRYHKAKNGILTSRRNFLTLDGKTVIVELDLNNKKYRILDAVTMEEVASGGNTRNQSVLKIQSKRALTELGVSFAEEVRDRSSEPVIGQ